MQLPTSVLHDALYVKNLRKSKGLNQVEFAARLGVTQPLISQLETNRLKVSKKIKQQIETVFGSESV